MTEVQTKIVKDEPEKKAQTMEEIRAEAELIRAKIDLDELKGLRDKPETLKQKEAVLGKREKEIQAREDSARGKEERLTDLENHLATREQNLIAREEHFARSQVVIKGNLTRAALEVNDHITTLKRFISLGGSSHNSDLRYASGLEELEASLQAIKEWRKRNESIIRR